MEAAGLEARFSCSANHGATLNAPTQSEACLLLLLSSMRYSQSERAMTRIRTRVFTTLTTETRRDRDVNPGSHGWQPQCSPTELSSHCYTDRIKETNSNGMPLSSCTID